MTTSPPPYWQSKCGNYTLYCGDCLDILPTITADSIMTDPPYSSGGFQEAGKASGSIGNRKQSRILRDNLSTRGYGRLMRRALLAVPSATEVYMFTDWRMWIETFDAIEDGGFRVRSMIVWNKRCPGLGAGWRSQHELIGYGRKSTVPPGSPSAGNILSVTKTANEHHPTEKPVELMLQLLQVSTSRSIVDPFAGSGSTGVACAKDGRPFVGIELDESFCEIAAKRIDAACSHLYSGVA